ncbi:hypothetical protein F2Q68_00039611 [Brassica cretica]|uniref:Uncharacterized protein n=1 Tax=Brassica cretica TaxID=69181 RepID=A0A8S9MD31_BRACR|nr:hypothetical protein F2Q68_00039611 [Brassica cretica]
MRLLRLQGGRRSTIKTLAALPPPFKFACSVSGRPGMHAVATMMPATRLATHRPNLKAGSVYSLTGFDVARCNPNYRLSDSSLLIRFSDSTYFKEVTDPAVPSPPESFRFRNHSEMLGLANTNNQLPDLIGDITDVKSTVTDPPQGSMTMSLFDAQAVNIHNQLEKMRGDPRVVVATSVNPKMGGGG